MLHSLHLVRHGEVHNPDGVVYADLPGFVLSDLGREQARAAAARIGSLGADLVVTSPIARARETAAPIAAALGTTPMVDERLREWDLSRRWAGVRWVDLPERFPGEVEAYLADPANLPFSPESIDEVGRRMSAVVDGLGRSHPGKVVVLVSHQDPVQALRLSLRGLSWSSLSVDKPGHACVITLVADGLAWEEVAAWEPAADSPT